MSRRSLADLLGNDASQAAPAEKPRAFACGSGANLGAITSTPKLTFDEFCARIANPLRDKHTEAEFHALPREEREAIKKRAGWHIGGRFNGAQRKQDATRFRTTVCVDVDEATPELIRAIERETTPLSRFTFVAHETHRSTKAQPRIRIIVFLAARVSPESYAGVARAAARMAVPNLAGVDETCFEHWRLMYWPSRPADSEYWWFRNDGEFLDAATLTPDEESAESRSRENAGDLATIAHNRRQFASFDELADAVMAVKNDERFGTREAWRDFIAAIKFECEGLELVEEGRALAHEWSAGWRDGDHTEHTDETWDTLHNDPSRRLTTGRLIMKYARENGWRPKRRKTEDRSMALFDLAAEHIRDGKSFDEFGEAWPRDPNAAACVETDSKGAERTEEQRARYVEKIWRKAGDAVARESSHILLASDALIENLKLLDSEFMTGGHDIFQRSGEVVFVRDEVEGTRDGKKIWTPQIIPMSVQQIQQEAMRGLKFLKPDERKGRLVPVECPRSFAEHYLHKTEWRLPYLYGIVSHPTIRADGSIVEAEGYDAATGVFMEPSIKFPPIPAAPTARQVSGAVAALRDVVRGFDFADDAAFAVWAACLISALIRPALPIAPIYGFDAPMAGSGKTKLATAISLIARGETVETMNQAPHPEEEEKRMFAALRAGRRFILIDNCTRPLDGEHLCAISTSPKWGARILGLSEEKHFPTAVTIMATGNQLAFRGDLASRAFVCRLAPKVENPRERRFGWVFEDECLERRGELVAAALTIVRGYLSGEQGLQSRTRFPEWDCMVRQSLMAAGLPDVCATMQPEADSADRETGVLRDVLAAWHGVFGGRGVRLKRLADQTEDAGAKGDTLLKLLGDVAWSDDSNEPFDKDRLGRWLRGKRDVFAGGRVLRCEPDEKHGAKWRVE